MLPALNSAVTDVPHSLQVVTASASSKAGWHAERVDSAPGPEWSAAECQAVLSRWDRGQPVRSHDAAAFIDGQRASDEQFDALGRNAR